MRGEQEMPRVEIEDHEDLSVLLNALGALEETCADHAMTIYAEGGQLAIALRGKLYAVPAGSIDRHRTLAVKV